VPLALLAARLGGASTTVGPAILLPFLAVPAALPLVRVVYGHGDPRRLNAVLRGTARLTLLFSVLFALGLGLGR